MNSQNLNVFHRYLFDNDKMVGSLFSQELHLGPAVLLNLLHPNISMLILLTVLYKPPIVPTRRICSTIKSLFSW